MAIRDIATPPKAVAALASYVRARLTELSAAATGTARRDGGELVVAEQSVVAAARHFAVAVVGAAAPFAPTPYARARLLRQMHASGLLTDDEVRRTETLLDPAAHPHVIDA